MHRRAFALRHVASLVAGTSALVAAVYFAPNGPAAVAHTAMPAKRSAVGAKHTLREALSSAGFMPASLAASGLNETAATALITRVEDHLNGDGSGFQAAINAYRTASRQVKALEAKVQSGKATTEDTATLATARTTLATATANRDNAIAAVISSGQQGLDASIIAVLTKLRQNKAWDLPSQYLVVTRTDAEWLKLRDALAIQRSATSSGTSVDSDTAQFLLSTNADMAVVAAQIGLSNLAAVEAAWDAAVSAE